VGATIGSLRMQVSLLFAVGLSIVGRVVGSAAPTKPKLLVGVCGSQGSYDKFWPAIVAAADISRRSSSPVLDIPDGTNFDVEFVFGETAYSQDLASALAIEWMIRGVDGRVVNAVIGCMSSSISDTVARVGSIFSVPQISWFSGSHRFTASHSSYTYFSRTIASMAGVQEHVVWILAYFSWRSATMFYLHDPYLARYEADVFNEARLIAADMNISISGVRLSTLAYRNEVEDWSLWEQSVATGKSYANVIYIIMCAINGFRAMEIAQSQGLAQHTWIYGHIDNLDTSSLDPGILASFNGMLGSVSLQDPSTAESQSFQDFWTTHMTMDSVAPYVPSEFQWKMGNDTWPDSVLRKYHVYLFDAASALFHAFSQLVAAGYQEQDIGGALLLETMRSINFQGTSGLVTFSEVGDREGMRGDIFNFQSGVLVHVGQVTPERVSFLEGQTVIFANGSLTPPSGLPPACPGGLYYDGAQCVGCGPGQQVGVRSGEAESPCVACSLGRAGTNLCEACSFGFFANETGLVECNLCTLDHSCESLGMSRPTPCQGGTFSIEEGSIHCRQCPVGTFSTSVDELPNEDESLVLKERLLDYHDENGTQTRCKVCPRGMTTAWASAAGVGDCVCNAGSFHRCFGDDCILGRMSPLEDDFCHPCPSGMVCDGELSSPLAMVEYVGGSIYRHRAPRIPEGMMAIDEVVYACAGSGAACPGAYLNAPIEQMCSSGGSGVACAACQEDTGWSGTECEPCSTGTEYYVRLGGFIFLLVSFLFAWWKKSTPWEPEGAFTETSLLELRAEAVTSCTEANFIGLVSTLGILDKASAVFPDPMRDVQTVFGQFLDLQLFGVECSITIGARSYPVLLVSLLNLAPLMFLVVWGLLLALAKCRPHAKSTLWPSAFRVYAILPDAFTMFFIVIVNWAVNLGFSTFSHPGVDAGSLRAFPHILVTDSEGLTIRLIAFCGILFWCIGGLASVVWVLVILPRRIVDDVEFFKKTISLVALYRGGYTWWVLVKLLHDLLISMSVTISERAEWQMFYMTMVLVGYICLLLSASPHYSRLCLYSELTANLGKLALVTCNVLYSTGEGALLTNFIFNTVLLLGACWVVAAMFMWTCKKKHHDKEKKVGIGGAGERRFSASKTKRNLGDRLVRKFPALKEFNTMIRVKSLGSADDLGSMLGSERGSETVIQTPMSPASSPRAASKPQKTTSFHVQEEPSKDMKALTAEEQLAETQRLMMCLTKHLEQLQQANPNNSGARSERNWDAGCAHTLGRTATEQSQNFVSEADKYAPTHWHMSSRPPAQLLAAEPTAIESQKQADVQPTQSEGSAISGKKRMQLFQDV